MLAFGVSRKVGQFDLFPHPQPPPPNLFQAIIVTGMTYMTSKYFIIDEREINVLFNDALNTFYLQLYGVRHS